jgi:hypothetical protein
MENDQTESSGLRADALVKLKKDLEQSRWNKKWALKFVEASAFAGMFLCSNPIGFQICVIVGALAVLLDVYLNYDEWKQDWNFKMMIS